MKKCLIILSIAGSFIYTGTAYAQRPPANAAPSQGQSYSMNSNMQQMHDKDGKLIPTRDYSDVVGSPYLSKEWSVGTAVTSDNKAYKDVQLNYNLMEDQLTFKNEKGEELAFAEPIKEFSITYKDEDSGQTLTNIYRNGYNGINRTTANSYFQVVSDGKTQLLKKTTVGIVMSQEWNSATKVKNFKDETKYYIVKDGKPTQVKKDKKVIFTLLADKGPQLEAYANTNKLNFKSDEDLDKLIKYYNTL